MKCQVRITKQSESHQTLSMRYFRIDVDEDDVLASMIENHCLQHLIQREDPKSENVGKNGIAAMQHER